jgi:FKBP-type peptidyl-prolyl cis-trans isomerase SlyD
MQITPRVIAFHYTLKNPAGEVLDSSSGADPLRFLEGAGQIIPGLEEQLVLLQVGDKRTVQVAAARAYGEVDPTLMVEVTKDRLGASKELEVGDQFATRGPNGEPGGVFTVVKLEGEKVTLDGNHPLAGVDLSFEIEIMSVRDATQAELSHGHAHEGSGHHH